MKNLFLCLFFSLTSHSSQAFVLTSGTVKATLGATPNAPDVTFYWNGSAPSLKDIDDFEDGILKGKTDEEVMKEVLIRALALWNDVPGSYINLKLETDQNTSVDAEDNRHSLVVKKIDNISTAAFAFPKVEDEEIIDCDITISNASVSAESLAYTIAHEMGHCLGLGHPHTNYDAMMGYSRTDRSLRLGADDMAGVIYLYPDPEYDANDPKELISCGTIGNKNKNNPSIILILLFNAPIMALAIQLGIRGWKKRRFNHAN